MSSFELEQELVYDNNIPLINGSTDMANDGSSFFYIGPYVGGDDELDAILENCFDVFLSNNVIKTFKFSIQFHYQQG